MYSTHPSFLSKDPQQLTSTQSNPVLDVADPPTQVLLFLSFMLRAGAVRRWGREGARAHQIQKVAGKIFKRFKMPIFPD